MQEILAKTTRAFLKPIEPFLQDDTVSEVMINGAATIYIEQKGRLVKTAASFEDEEQLMAAVRNIAQFVGRRVDEKQPIMDARLSDGSRIHVILPPCARQGIYMTIRKFTRDHLLIKDLVKLGSISVECAKFINLCVAMSKNIIVAGGTSSGKTTLLNVLSGLIPDEQRIIVIEDSSELNLQQEHVITMETRAADKTGQGEVTIRDLLRSSLRLRPDRIVIGEVRGGEAIDLLQAMNTGHSGSMSTLHANDPRLALSRLETLALMSGVDMPLRALRSQVASAIDVVVQAQRMRDGKRRITHVTEVLGLDEQGNYQTRDIFLYHISKTKEDGAMVGSHKATGELPSFFKAAQAQGYKIDRKLFS